MKTMGAVGLAALSVAAVLSGCKSNCTDEGSSGPMVEAKDVVEDGTLRIQRSLDHTIDWEDFSYEFTPDLTKRVIQISRTRGSNLVGSIDFNNPAVITVLSCANEETLSGTECQSTAGTQTPALRQTASGTFEQFSEHAQLKAAGTAITVDARLVHKDAYPLGAGNDTCD